MHLHDVSAINKNKMFPLHDVVATMRWLLMNFFQDESCRKEEGTPLLHDAEAQDETLREEI